jgi:CubicO group peptidase (beta-lactamase class C family)
MHQRLDSNPSRPLERLPLALAGLLLACSGVAAPAPAAPALGEQAAVAPRPAPRYASDALPVDFRHPERETAIAALLPRLAERIDAFFAANKPPSVAVAVVADGEVRLRRVLGFAHVLGEVEATPSTLYRIGSVTKTFTTALVLSLRDGGRLALDAPVEQYWPELGAVEYPFPDAARISVRHLLTHTSGLPRLGGFDYTKPDSNVTDAVLLDALASARLETVPGTRYVYSNFGMSLLGFFAGRMSSEGSLRAALERRVTGPLGMSSTRFDPATLAAAAVATGYDGARSLNVAPLWNLGASEAAGGLWSSLDDMARWVRFQLSAWPPRSGAELGPLRRATLREQHMPGLPFELDASLDGTSPSATVRGIGLGWHTRRSCELEHLVEHGGAIDGFKAAVAFAPERDFGVVVLANAIDTQVVALQDELVKLAAAALPAREARPSAALVAALDALGESLASCPPSAFEALFDRGFRGVVGKEKYETVCAGLSRRHGRCAFGEALSLDSASSGSFVLRCERGAVHARASVHLEDGQTRFGGLWVRSTGFPVTPQQARAAEAALKLYERWDDQAFAAAFAKPDLRDAVKSGFAQVHDERGRCELAPDALAGLYGDGERQARLPLRCERGGAQELELTLDDGGKLSGIFLRGPEGGARGGCG